IDDVITLDDVLVHLGTTGDVIGLDREHFLQGVRSTVSLECPDFHRTKALATELSLTTKRLLRNERIGARRTRVHLVVDQVMQLEVMHVTDSDRTFELVAGAAVVQPGLSAIGCELELLGFFVGVGQLENLADLLFGCTVKHWGSNRHAVLQIASHFNQLVIGQVFEVSGSAAGVVYLLQVFAQLLDLYATFILKHFGNTMTKTLGCPAQVNFEYLSDVHPRRNAQRVKNNVDRGTVGHVRHVLDRGNTRNNTLVTVTTGHFVTWLQATLDGQIDLDHLEHAGGQFVALCKLLALFFEGQIKLVTLVFERLFGLLEHDSMRLVGQANVEPLPAVEIVKVFACNS